MDVRVTTDERGFSRTAKSCGPGAPVLALSVREQIRADDGGNKPVTGESAKETVKPSRRESRDVSGSPVVLLPCFLCTGPMGAIGTRLSLRPRLSEEQDSSNNSGDPRRGNAELYPLFDNRRAGAAFAPLASAGFELSVDLRSVLTVTR